MKKTKAGTTFRFTLILTGVKAFTGRMCDALYRAGCDDALPGAKGGVAFLDFHRQADSFHEAVFSAVQAVETALAAKVVRVEADDPPIDIQFIHKSRSRKQLSASRP
jgi:hypothetical protein